MPSGHVSRETSVAVEDGVIVAGVVGDVAATEPGDGGDEPREAGAEVDGGRGGIPATEAEGERPGERGIRVPDVGPVPPVPGVAAAVFGDRVGLAEAFVARLADTGVSHGLIGPREVPRLWDRHVLNCAVIEDAFPVGAMVIDVGSGAGLPGIALAIARPDLDVHLVEPMLRRTTWLTESVTVLGLTNVTVHRGRAEELRGGLAGEFVTARAVARLGKLALWCVPLLRPGGRLVAMKGRSAAVELAEDRAVLARLGLVSASVSAHGAGLLDEAVLTIDATFAPRPRRAGRSRGLFRW